jgi:hypothetical protein
MKPGTTPAELHRIPDATHPLALRANSHHTEERLAGRSQEGHNQVIAPPSDRIGTRAHRLGLTKPPVPAKLLREDGEARMPMCPAAASAAQSIQFWAPRPATPGCSELRQIGGTARRVDLPDW